MVELHRVTDRHVKQMKGMKPKKLHEVRSTTGPSHWCTLALLHDIGSCSFYRSLLVFFQVELFAGLVDCICDAANSSFVMDIGAGAVRAEQLGKMLRSHFWQGYVGLMLRNRCRRRILAIEGSETCSEGAIARMSRLGRKKRSIRTQLHHNHEEKPHGDNTAEHGAASTVSSHPYKEHEEPLRCTPDIDVATCMLFYDDDDVVPKANDILVSSLVRACIELLLWECT